MKIIDIIRASIIEPTLEFTNRFISVNKTKASKEKWAKNAQTGEFNFHKTNGWRNTPQFMEDTVLLLDSFGFNRDEYKGKTVLDLGAGSKLRSKYFKGAKLVVIEPMADDCIREIPWTDLNDAEKVYSLPAEDLIEELKDTVDFVMSINVLDHCFDFEDIVDNVHKYLKKGGLAFLSFDAHFTTNKMHPLILTDSICTEIFERKGFKIEKKNKGFSGKFKKERKVVTYGHGSYCLNYWLRK